MKTSKNNLCVTSDGSVEFYERDGQVYRAQMSSVIMPDGYRVGRWESSVAHFNHFRQVIVW